MQLRLPFKRSADPAHERADRIGLTPESGCHCRTPDQICDEVKQG
jgi:hypothetical protein